VFHGGDILVGESRSVEVGKVLERGGPVVICGTLRSAGSRTVRQQVRAARARSTGVRIFGVQMEPDADLDPLVLDERVAAWWQSREKALDDLLAALHRYASPDHEGLGGVPVSGTASEPAARSPGNRAIRNVTSASLRVGFEGRVADACRERNPGAVVRMAVSRHDGHPAYLDVELRDKQGVVSHWPVGLAPHGLDDEVLDCFVEQVHAEYERENPRVVSEIVFFGDPVGDEFASRAAQRGVRISSVFEYEWRWNPRRYLEHQGQRLLSDVHYPPGLYVAQRFMRLERGTQDSGGQADLLRAMLHWLDSDAASLVLVFGDFGNGKSFLLRQLARQIPTELPHLVPLLVELRDLEKVNDLDVLLAQHLAKAGEYPIDVPAVRKMLARGQIVLLFDGFDELAERITYDEASAHLRTVLSAASDKAKVVLTSRSQHFRSDDQWRTALGARVRLLSGSRQVRIADFDPDQIRAFLVNLVRIRGGSEKDAEERLALINGIHDLLSLSRNPRMLSYVAGLPAEDLRAAKDRTGRISSADIYRLLVDQWLAFEVSRRRRPAQNILWARDGRRLRRAVDALAIRMWDSGEDTTNILGLETTVRDVLTDLSELGLDVDQAAHVLGSGSLLVRDDERFSFVHRSVMEYLVAAFAVRQIDTGSVGYGPWNHRPLSDLMVDFLCGSAKNAALAAWVHRVLGDPDASPTARDNAFRVTRKIDLPIRGARLAGQDLRGRDLSEVILSDADLSHANLAGAHLHCTDLTGADLRNADLRGAQLSGAKLVGARVEGCMWDRAVLRGATIDGEAAETMRRAGAELDRVSIVRHAGDGTPTVSHSQKDVVALTREAFRAAGREIRPAGEPELLEPGPVCLFDSKNALVDERHLFGRDVLLNTIGSTLRRGEHILVSGLRKVGKTSLLNIFRQHVVDIPVCMVDLQRYDRESEDWPPALFGLILQAFDRWGSTEQGEWPFEASRPVTATEFGEELERRASQLGDLRARPQILVVLDELERVFPTATESDAVHRWVRAMGALRAFSQGNERFIAVIGADLRPAANRENMLGGDLRRSNPFFDLFQEMPLPLLDVGALAEMVESLAHAMGVDDVEPDFTRLLFERTGGHPSLARVIAGESYRNRRHPGKLRAGDLDAGLEYLESRNFIGTFMRKNLWQFMTPVERSLICDLTRPRHGARADSSRWNGDDGEALASLESLGLVDSGEIRIGLFRRWVHENGGSR
jgi:hypothetical protein